MSKSKKNNMKKDFFWNSIGTAINAFNSLFFMIIVTRINGVDDAGVFTFGFSLACLLYVIGIYSGRIYQVTENNKKITDSDYFYLKIISCILMLIVGIIYSIINKYNLYKFIIILFLTIFKLLEAFSEFSYAIIQKDNKLYKVGKSLFIKSLLSLLLFLIIDFFTENLVLSILTILFSNLIIIFFYDIPNVKSTNFNINKINKDNVKELLTKGFYAFGFSFLTMYIINASKYSMDGLLPSKYQTIFGIILMPATIMSLCAQFIIQPFILKLKNLLNSNLNNFIKLSLKLSLFMLIFGVLAIIAALILGIPILNLLYGIKLNNYKIELIIIMLGATLYGITIILSNALTTMRFTKNQFNIFLIDSLITLITSRYLIKQFKIFGASLSYLISMLLLLILYIIIFISSINKTKGEKNKNGKSINHRTSI